MAVCVGLFFTLFIPLPSPLCVMIGSGRPTIILLGGKGSLERKKYKIAEGETVNSVAVPQVRNGSKLKIKRHNFFTQLSEGQAWRLQPVSDGWFI